MESRKIKSAFIKAFSIVAICFSMSILFIGLIFSLLNVYIEPVYIVKIWVMFFILGIITIFRIMAESSRWALSKPFYVKNIVFMPLYLIVSVITAMDIAGNTEIIPRSYLIILYAFVFLVAFTIRQVVGYIIEKAKTDKMNDALIEFQKEHSWDEEE